MAESLDLAALPLIIAVSLWLTVARLLFLRIAKARRPTSRDGGL